MLQDIVIAGTTSYTGARIRVIDSTDGTPETGFAYNTSGIDLWYQRQGATRTAITEATLAAVDSAYSSGGVIHVSDGYCRLDLPDAALGTGATFVDFGGTATGMVIIGGRIKLDAPVVDMRYILGHLLTQTGTQLADGFQTFFDVASPTTHKAITGVTLAATQTGVTIPTVTTLTNAVTLANGAHGGAAATMQLGGAGGLTATHTGNTTGSVGSVTGAVGSVTGAVGSVAGAVGSVTAGVTVTTNNDKTGYALSAAGVQAVWDALSSALTTVGSIGKRLVDYLTGDVFARVGAPAGASIAADVAAVKTDTAASAADAAKARKLLGNKMAITDATGEVVLYDDDNTTPIDIGTPTISDNSTTTTRLKVL